MAYTPSTLKTAGPHGMFVLSASPEPESMRIWTYSTEDAMTTVRAANYITDAQLRGMQENDVVFVMTTAAGAPSTLYVTACISVASTGADLADGTAVTLTNS